MKKLVIISVILIVTLCAGIFCYSIFIKEQPKTNVFPFDALYGFKNTALKDSSIIHALLNDTNLTSYPIRKVNMPTEDDPDRINIIIKVSDRSKYRHIENDNLDKTTAILFSLIPDMNELGFYFFDDWGDISNLETAFTSSYYNKENFKDRSSFEAFTPEVIKNSTASLQDFKKYCRDILSVTPQQADTTLSDAVNNFIGADNEVIVNSGMASDVIVDDEFFESEKYNVLKNTLGELTLENYKGKTIKIQREHIRNFKTNDEQYCAFILDESNKENPLVFAKFITTEEAVKIRLIITDQY